MGHSGPMHSRDTVSFLRILCNLRWMAVAGQALTVGLVTGPMAIPLPLLQLWSGIALLALFNVYVTWRVRRTSAASDWEVLAHLLFDIVMLAWLVSFSGGMENPFASLFLIPIALSVLILPSRLVAVTALCSVAAYGVSTVLGRELPPGSSNFSLHKLGMLANFLVSAAVLLVFFARMAVEKRRREAEVARLREQFTRNEGILALATHAASVAHELNTPLGTMTLMVEELQDEARDAAEKEQFAALKSLLDICRDRVRALAAPADSHAEGGSPLVDINQVVQHWQLVRPTIELHRSGSVEGFSKVDPAIGHLLQALLNNAADASGESGESRVDLQLDSDAGGVRGMIRDYGLGLDEVRPPLPAVLFRTSKSDGLGIGLALSHATVERLGGQLSMQATEGRGVRVEFRLPAADNSST